VRVLAGRAEVARGGKGAGPGDPAWRAQDAVAAHALQKGRWHRGERGGSRLFRRDSPKTEPPARRDRGPTEMEPEPPAKRKLDGPHLQASTSDDAALGESLLPTRLLSGGTTRLRPPSTGNFCQLVRLLLLFLVVPSALGFCETFKTACPIAQIGVPVNNGNEILLANRGSYYLTLMPSASTPKTLQLIASILYGRVEFFVRFGDKEPSSNSFDLSSALSGMPDFLGIVSLPMFARALTFLFSNHSPPPASPPTP